ncbi:MAG: hypothetical protein DRJ55_06045 [Thermoprotei archaeon]|nr:MAG: hypothetical protein DRJ55_06045 [Thermoprotei archaeon]HDJ96990.1 hypothetical protein [Thermofilum sp.]
MAVEAGFLRERFRDKSEGAIGRDRVRPQESGAKPKGYISKSKLEEMKRVVERLGGDTSWIDAIPERLKEIDVQIAKLEKQISELKEEKEFLISFLSRL